MTYSPTQWINDSRYGELHPDALVALNNIETGVLTAESIFERVHNPDGTQRNYLAPSGSIRETLPRDVSQISNVSPLTGGTLFLQAIELFAGEVVNALSFTSGSTAANGPTHQWACLVDGSLNVLAKSADLTSTAWGADALQTFTLTAPYTVLASGLFYIGLLVTATTAVPSLRGISANAAIVGQTPILGGSSTTGLTDPASLGGAAAAITTGTIRSYAVVK